MSSQPEHLLARGFGFQHLCELMLSLAGPMVRNGAGIAYGGHWKRTDDNFTYELLQLISSEQEDISAAEQEDSGTGGGDSRKTINRLVNHSAWPEYLDVTPKMEAQWILSCRIVRI